MTSSPARDASGKIVGGIAVAQNITERKRAEQSLFREIEKNKMLFSTAGDGLHVMDVHGNLLQASNSFCKMLGYTQEEVSSMNVLQWDALLPPNTRFEEIVNGVPEDGFMLETRHRCKDGRVIDVEIFSNVVSIQGIRYVFASSRDITERLANARLLETNKQVLDTTQDGFWLTDVQGNLQMANQAYANMSGYSVDELVHMHISQLDAKEQSIDEVKAHIDKIITRGSDKFETLHRHKDGHLIDIEITTNYLRESKQFAVFARDIAARKESEEEIKHLAFFDPLTQLPNRRLLLDRLRQAMVSSERSGKQGALLFIDLDNFKILNDTLGHDIGDLLLQQVSQRLVSCVREGDTVARIGGDEFVVMLEDLSENAIESAAQTESIGQKILASLSQSYKLGAYEHHTSSSIGISLYNGHGTAIDELMKQADIAMYQSKSMGRNTLHFFDSKMQDSINNRASLEVELRKAIEQNQFQLYFQLQVDNALRPLGAETLIRWIHPTRGLVSPAQFIPLAEESELILPIGQWVLQTACAQIKLWQQNTLTRDLVLAVNVSVKQFRQSDFVDQVRESVVRNEIRPNLLKLELTESMLQENIESMIATMKALKEFGVLFSLDDFGTGYSSLQYIKRLPLDQLKIDQSFVRDLSTDSSDKAIVRTIIAMAQSLKLDVIAEGVETEEQRQLLLHKGCAHFQGYLIGKPVPLEEFERALVRANSFSPNSPSNWQ
jgi:diguanylate cyclase (GGDEF)-like protein/PAS domain S-box-containing protein